VVAGGQQNLSGTDFHASPEGVRLRDEPNNLTARQFNWIRFDALNETVKINVKIMVAGGRIELPTRGFSERRYQFALLFFNNLPGRPLPILHNYA